jgi:hypothetical protein
MKAEIINTFRIIKIQAYKTPPEDKTEGAKCDNCHHHNTIFLHFK